MLSVLIVMGAVLLIPGALLLLIAKHGTLRYAPGFLATTLLAAAAILLGVLFKIQHWEGGYGLLLGGAAGLGLVYGWWFVRKPTKNALDVLKLVFVAACGLNAAAIAFSLMTDTVGRLRTLSFWGLALYFLYLTYGRKSAAGSR